MNATFKWEPSSVGKQDLMCKSFLFLCKLQLYNTKSALTNINSATNKKTLRSMSLHWNVTSRFERNSLFTHLLLNDLTLKMKTIIIFKRKSLAFVTIHVLVICECEFDVKILYMYMDIHWLFIDIFHFRSVEHLINNNKRIEIMHFNKETNFYNLMALKNYINNWYWLQLLLLLFNLFNAMKFLYKHEILIDMCKKDY